MLQLTYTQPATLDAQLSETEDMLGLLEIEDFANDSVETQNNVLEVIEQPTETKEQILEQVLEGIDEQSTKKIETKEESKAPENIETIETKEEAEIAILEETHNENEQELETLTEKTLQEQCEAEMVKLETEMKAGSFFTQKKVEEKVRHFFKTLRGGAGLNTVVKIALETYKRDGYIESGRKGNLYQALLEKPYSIGTANAQSGQIIDMFPRIGMMIKDGKTLKANPDSKILEYALNLV